MAAFARNTPPEVANWLRAELAKTPDCAILRALANDDRMSELWAELEEWPLGALAVVQLAFHFTIPTILSNLQKPPQERWPFSWPEYPLGVAAKDLVHWLIQKIQGAG